MENREIKFRVWDIDKKKFIQGLTLRVDNMSESKKDWHILSQFTGLHDKNGKEIYEGDIVTITHNNVTAKGTAKVIFSYEYSGGWVVTSNGIDRLNIGTRPKSFEIIGNIYENPELLK